MKQKPDKYIFFNSHYLFDDLFLFCRHTCDLFLCDNVIYYILPYD